MSTGKLVSPSSDFDVYSNCKMMCLQTSLASLSSQFLLVCLVSRLLATSRDVFSGFVFNEREGEIQLRITCDKCQRATMSVNSSSESVWHLNMHLLYIIMYEMKRLLPCSNLCSDQSRERIFFTAAI